VDVSYRGATYNLSIFGREGVGNEVVDFLRRAICYNQGEFAQYAFLAAELHKALKSRLYSRTRDKTAVQESLTALNDYLNRNLRRVCCKNFEFLLSHFRARDRTQPRVCIKASHAVADTEHIVAIFRNTQANYSSDCGVEGNTAFKYIYDTGRYYLCNDIPKDAKAKQYVNPRLNLASVELYKLPNRMTRLLSLDKGVDEKWKKCWQNPNQSTLTDDSCYKSTLIVPMTLWNNDLEQDYKDLINIADVDRTIFGFLCFDHINRDYFVADLDIGIGYIFADLLSLYLIMRLVYTEISKTYQQAKQFLMR
jgi:hypothetical protein